MTVGQDLLRIELGDAPAGGEKQASEAAPKEEPKAEKSEPESKPAPAPPKEESKPKETSKPAPPPEKKEAPKSAPNESSSSGPTLGSREERKVRTSLGADGHTASSY